MAGTIKGMTIEIGGNTAPLEQALKQTNKEINSTQKELREVNKLLKLDPNNVTLLKQKQELLTEAIGKTTTKLDALKQAQKQLDEEMKNGGNVNREEYRKLEREIATTESSLSKLKDEAKKTGDQMNKSSVDVKKMADATKQAGEMALTCTKALIDFTNMGVKAMAGAVTTAVATITKLAVESGNLADEINTLSSVTGISTKQLQEFQYASDLIDVDVNTLAGSLKKLTSNMATAKKGSGDAYDTFKELGVEFQNADGTLRNSNDVFNDTIRALGNISNETERDATAMKLFGKSATELNPLIEGGIDTLDEMSQKANKLGLILSQDTLDGANRFNDALDTLKANGKGLFNVIGSEIASKFAPELENVNGYFENIISNLTNALNEGGFEGLIDELSKTLSDVLTKAVEKLPDIAKTVTELIKKIIGGIKDNASQMGEGVATLYTTLVEGFYEILPDLIDVAIKLVTSFIGAIGDNLEKIIPTIVNGLLDILDVIVDNIDLVVEAGIKVIEGLIKGILQALPSLIQRVPEIILPLVSTLLEQIPVLIEAMTTIWLEIVDFLSKPENIMMLVETAINFVMTMANTLLDNLPTIIDAVINMYSTAIERLTDPETLEQLIDMTITLVMKVAETMIENMPIILEKLPVIIEAICTGLLSLAGNIISAGVTLITTVVGKLLGKVKEAGSNLIKGLWEGINGMKDWIMSKIRSLCTDMLDSIKSFFGIESPSKVMANEVGSYMAKGIGVGFDKTMPSVIDAMKEKLTGVTDAFRTELSFGDIPQVQGNTIVSENSYVTKNYTNTIETIRQPQAIELVLDGTKVARAIIPPLNNEYNRLGVKI